MRRLAVSLLFAATLSLALGVTQPVMAMTRLFLFTDKPSLATIVAGLWTEGETVLALLVGAFSMAFPALKILLLLIVAVDGPERDPPAWLRALANWSMLDVVLVALAIFAAKTSGLANAFTLPGLWLFTLSVALTALASHLLARQGA